MSIATKVLVVDLYAVQGAVPARNQKKKQPDIDGQIRCITADFKPKGANVAWNVTH